MSKHDEKVIAEWPEGLRDEDQKLEPLPDEGDTDFVVLRFQGKDVNRRFAVQVKKFAQELAEANPGEFDLAFVTVTQQRNRYAPKNAWPLVRGIFDYILNWSKA